MRTFLSPLSDALALILPRDCPVCRGDLPWNAPAGVCLPCWSETRPLRPPFCPACGLPYETLLPTADSHLCSDCYRKPPPFGTARSLGRYEETLREVLHLFKYERRPEIGEVLGKLMAVYWENLPDHRHPDAVAAVPLHRSRRRQRGYNQAEVLARAVGKHLKVPYLGRCLRRPRPGPPQTGLTRPQRHRNVRNQFRVARPRRLRGRSILLVDDILTTGATVTECARLIRRAGAGRVDVLTAARTGSWTR